MRAVSIIFLILSFIITEAGLSKENRISGILVNQVGYLTHGRKLALLVNIPSNIRKKPVSLIEKESKRVVFKVYPKNPVKDKQTGDLIQQLDFSSFNQKGIYFLKLDSYISYPFKIGDKVFMEPMIKMIRSYYLQRCGIKIDDPITHISHPPCHLQDAIVAHTDPFHKAGEHLCVKGGWHDAGDYGKYIATASVSVGQLLHLFEQRPKFFGDGQLLYPDYLLDEHGKPENNNSIPDLLDELRFELNWMLSMQREDGAVYRKVAGKRWPPLVPPHKDNQARFIYGVSTPETAKFAAAMAMAARIYYGYDPSFANRCLSAAKKAWNYLIKHPSMYVEWYEGDDSGSGKYLYSEIDRESSLLTDLDDRFWAAAELFITANSKSAKLFIDKYIKELPYSIFEWKNPSSLGLLDLYLCKKVDASLRNIIRQKIISYADQALNRIEHSGYKIANHRFIWGSNKMTAEEGITLYYAYQITKKKAYLYAAIDQIDYLLGRNPFNKCFVTGIGSNPVKNPCHIFCRASHIYIPGQLVGGPNEMAQAKIAPKNKGPLSYKDDARSYATNEYAIDYNASLICLMGLILDKQD